MVKLLSDGQLLVYTASVFLILDIIAVAVRFVAKQKTKRGWAMDDLWISIALLFTAAYHAVIISSQSLDLLLTRKLMDIGMVNVGGTYDVKKLQDPLSEYGLILKVCLVADATSLQL